MQELQECCEGLENQADTWIPVRAKEDSLSSSGDRFGCVSSAETWSKIVNRRYTLNQWSIYILVDDGFLDKLEQDGVELSQVEASVGYC